MDDLLAEYGQMDIGEMDLGRMLQQVLELARKHKISMPSGVTMLARGLCTLQGLIADISPETSLIGVVSQRFAYAAWRDIDWKQLLRRDAEALYESAQKSLNIPALLSDTLRLAQKGQLKLLTEARSSRESEQFQASQARRMRLCLLCCAAFVGSSLMALAPSVPRLWGLPLPALAGFGICAALGFTLWLARKK